MSAPLLFAAMLLERRAARRVRPRRRFARLAVALVAGTAVLVLSKPFAA